MSYSLAVAKPLYDVALSFAGEQRAYVRAVAAALRSEDVSYFYDEERTVDLWGRNLVDELDHTYRLRARFVVMFVSEAYARKVWTNVERQSAQSRAIEVASVQPYILPVRFDDADLPGLPPSVHYISAGTHTPEELASMIGAKVTMAHNEESDEDRDDGWEYLLFIEELSNGLAGYEEQFRDHTLRYARPTGRPIELEDVPDDLAGKARIASKIVANVERVLSESALLPAFGAPGEPGDAQTIRHVAARVVDVYASLLRWAEEVRGTLAPEESEAIYYWTLSEFVDLPLRQIRAFVAELDTGVRPHIEAVRCGNPPDEPVHLEFTLELSLDPDIEERFHSQLRELASSVS